ncbi:murein biosynthesis protein MurJ, partial [Mycobacterium ulcerans]
HQQRYQQNRRARSPAPTGATFGRRSRNLLIGIGAGAAILLVALLVLASVLNKMFGNVGGGLDQDQLGLNAPTASTSAAASSASAGSVVKPTKATVFSPDGEADNPGQADMAIDGDSTTSWETDTYNDPVPFPGFKNGVGLVLQLPQPTVVGSVTLDVPSTGTNVEIRSSPTPNPSKLDDTTVLTSATALKPGSNTIAVNASSPTSNLLVWISTLGTTDGKSRSAISQLTIRAAS